MKISQFTLALALFACTIGNVVAEGNTLACLNPDNVDYNKDYFPHKVQATHSELWDMKYFKTYKIFTNKKENTSFLLYQCGTEIPASEQGKHDGYHTVPLQDGIALSSTSDIPHVEQLGIRRQVKGWFSYHSYINSPCMSKLAEEPNSFIEVNADNQDQFFIDHPNVLVVKDGPTDSIPAANQIHLSTYKEEESKDIYEWHKVYGALFNLEKLANKQFDDSAQRFDCAADNATFLATKRRRLAAKPTIAWAYYSDPSAWGGSGEPYWDVGRCDEKNLYYCEFANICDADILHSNAGSIANPWAAGDFHMTTEEFVAFSKDADHWIYTGNNWNTVHDKFKTELDTFKSVQNNEVYDTSKSGSGTWFEQRIAEYDVVLQDFCEVVGNNDDSKIPHQRMYFRKMLPTPEPVGDLGSCPSAYIDLPWETRASECIYLKDDQKSEDKVSDEDHDSHEGHDHSKESSSVRAGLAATTISAVGLTAALINL